MNSEKRERPGDETEAFQEVQSPNRTATILANRPDRVQFVIEVTVDGLRDADVWRAIARATSGAPEGTHVRVQAGRTEPPVWVERYLPRELSWQITASDAATLRAWANALELGAAA